MVTTDTIEGVVNSLIWFHYDLLNDILYLRRVDCRDAVTYADEQPDGSLLLRREDNDEIAGLTIINWWRTYGSGTSFGSLQDFESSVEPFASRIAA